MQKILMLIDSLGSGGAQRQFVHLSVGLKRAGYAVTVLYYHPHDFFRDKLTEAGVDSRLLLSRGALSRILRVRSEIRREKPDTVISFLDTPNLLACLAKLTGAGPFRLIVSERNTDVGPLSLRRRLVLALYRVADLVVANARTQTDNLTRFPWIKSKLRWIPNCVDLERFKPLEARGSACDSPLLILVVASFQPHKNSSLIAEWAAGPGRTDGRFVFHWYGNQLLDVQPTLESGNSFLRAGEISKDSTALRMYPPSKEIERLYWEADAFCLPSFYEGTPNVICEAMASELPVLCSRVCENPHLVVEGENGFLFDPRDQASFISSLEKLHALGPVGRLEMGRRNRVRAESLFSEKKYTSSWIEVL